MDERTQSGSHTEIGGTGGIGIMTWQVSKTFRSTYATRMLRAGFDPPTVQHWLGHKSLETTMRYLSPAKDVHDRLNKVEIAGIVTIAPDSANT